MLMKSLQLVLLSISQVFGIIEGFNGKLDHESSCCILIAFLQSHTDYFTYASGEKKLCSTYIPSHIQTNYIGHATHKTKKNHNEETKMVY